MPLAKHIDEEDLLQQAKDHPFLSLVHIATPGGSKRHLVNNNGPYGGRYQTEGMPKYSLPQNGVSEDAAYEVITGELALDGKPALNLASFVHVWMPDAAKRLYTETLNINLVDVDEYVATTTIHGRCVSMLADLWHAPKETDPTTGKRKSAVGTATTGSSEAIMLGGLAMKRRWQEKMQKAGKDYKNPGPNVVFGSNAQVAIEKFARYFDVEERLVPISKESHYCMDPKKAIELVDENTIGVIVIMGSTYTGHFEPVKEMCELLDAYEKKTGIDIPVHVDGASGGFVAPFAYPKLEWDFRLPRVKSINVSGHKYGMAYVGVGWVVWRSEEYLPKHLIFELHYLGSVEYTFGLNFSRPAAPVLAQYYNFINLGFNGYKKVMQSDLKNARLLSRALENSGYFDVLSDIHRPASALTAAGTATGVLDESSPESYMPGLPVVSFRWTDEFKQKHPHLEQSWVQYLLRMKGFIVPNYGLAPPMGSTDILRVVVRDDHSEDMVELLVHEILQVTESLADSSSSNAHMAAALSKGHSQPPTSVAGGKHHHHHAHHPRKAHQLDHGSGHHAAGYSKQC